MTIGEFRSLVLSLPQATEQSHMGHPDFRIKGKIFATLFARDDEWWCMLKLSVEQQKEFVGSEPRLFSPIKGGWGRKGCTQARLGSINKNNIRKLRSAIFDAWCNVAPRRLIEENTSDGLS